MVTRHKRKRIGLFMSFVFIAYGRSSSALILGCGYKRKSVRAVLVARSTLRGSGIAHHCRTSKLAEASRRICYMSIPNDLTLLWTEYTYPHKPSTVCYNLDNDLKFTRFRRVKKERRVNAFHYFCCRPTRKAHSRAPAIRSATAKLATNFHIRNIYLQLFDSLDLYHALVGKSKYGCIKTEF